jgi:hypothetical protein
MQPFDRLYPQPNGESPTQQLIIQLSSPMPFDLSQTDLGEFKKLSPRWQDWTVIRNACAECALQLAPTLTRPARSNEPDLIPKPFLGMRKPREQDQGIEL